MKPLEPVAATFATAFAGAMTWISEADGILQLIVTILTLAWWCRVWKKGKKSE